MVSIDHSHSQQPVPRGFPLFKRCEWLVVNRDVAKRTSPYLAQLRSLSLRACVKV